MADIPYNSPNKTKIIKCNQFMVDNSSFLIAYVNRSYGGAVKTLDYAKKNDIVVFNLGEHQS